MDRNFNTPLKRFSILWSESKCTRTQQKMSPIVLKMFFLKKKRQLLAISMSLLLLSVEINFSGILEWHGKRKRKQEYCVSLFQSYGNI